MKRVKTTFLAFICVLIATILVILQLISINKALSVNKELLARSTQYQREFKKMHDAVSAKSKEEKNEAAKPLEEIN